MVKILAPPPTDEQLEQMMNRAILDAHKAINDSGYDPMIYANELMCLGLRAISLYGGKMFEEAALESVRLAFSTACFPKKDTIN